MIDQAKYSPTPWKTHLVDDTTIVGPDGREIATTCDSSQVEREDGYNIEYERMEADAAFIVRAVNSFDALVVALRLASITLDWASDHFEQLDCDAHMSDCHMRAEVCRAALKLAKGHP